MSPEPNLVEIEAAFHAGALSGDTSAAEALVETNGVAPDQRVGIYTNNIVGSLIEVLENTFPAIRRHVGEENFATLGRAFVTKSPPARPQLDLFGREFAAFLDGFEPARTNLPWLPDLARLEWATHESYFAEDALPLDPAALSGVPADAYGQLTFKAHPAAWALASEYPIVSLWRAERLEDVAEEGYQALVTRPDVTVETQAIGPAEYVLFASLSGGATLGAAAEAALTQDEIFDLQAGIAWLLSSGALHQFEQPT